MTLIPCPHWMNDAAGPMNDMAQVNRVMIHCTANSPDTIGDHDMLWRVHVEDNNWSHIGYHWVYDRAGNELACRPQQYEGAGASGHNHDCIHLSYFGGIDHNGNPEDNLLEVQEQLLVRRLVALSKEFPHLTATSILGHNEVDAKACPSFAVADKIPKWQDMASDFPEGEPGNPEPGMPGMPIGMLVELLRQQDARIDALEQINQAQLEAIQKLGRFH